MKKFYVIEDLRKSKDGKTGYINFKAFKLRVLSDAGKGITYNIKETVWFEDKENAEGVLYLVIYSGSGEQRDKIHKTFKVTEHIWTE